MAEQRKSARSFGPMIAFLAVVVGVIVMLWWMSKPPSPTGSQSPAVASASASARSAQAGPGAPSSERTLCSVDQVKKYIGSQLAAGEVPDSDLQQVASQVMTELVQAGVAQNGCVSPADVTAVLFDMSDDDNEGEGF
jgi:hypothetical protein